MHYDPVDFVRSSIRSIPDWPKPGVMFRDITPVLQDPRCFRALIDIFVYRYMRTRLDLVAGVDARGFILGSVIAYELNLGFVPIRKKGKLPYQTVGEDYDLEYGQASVEIHTDAVKPGQRGLQQGRQRVGLARQRIGLRGADQLPQRGTGLIEDRLRQTERRQQPARAIVADTRRERQAQPGGELVGVHGRWPRRAGRYVNGDWSACRPPAPGP